MTSKKILPGIILMIVLMAGVVYAAIQWGNPTDSGVRTGLNLPVCKTDIYGVKYWEKVVNELFDRQNSLNDCYRADGVDENLVPNDKCCPANKPLCRQVGTSAVWKCESSTNPIDSCEDYSTADCGSSNDIAIEQLTNSNVLSGTKFSCSYSGAVGTCTEYVDCICAVKNGECKPDAKLVIWNGTGMYTKGINENVNYNAICQATVSTGDCIIDITTVDNCNITNTKGVSWTVDWGGVGDAPGYCQPGSKDVPCPAQLNFVSLISIILTIILIIILYVIISRKKKVIKKEAKARTRKKKR